MDKTGTLTTNRIQYVESLPYQMDEDVFKRFLGDFVASVTSGNRTSEAIQAALPGEKWQILDEAPFGSSHKWSGLIVDDDTMRGAYILGAQEIVMPDLKSRAPQLIEQLSQWSDQGLRVILFAQAPDATVLRGDDDKLYLPEGIAPLGLVALNDELRPEARETLAGFAEAGIQLKIISGDNPHTVAALAAQVGFEGSGAITGAELDTMDDAEFGRAVVDNAIFGRITPDQKERLVETLRAQGAYVAMIGDGVNDTLALKKAHIGIAMNSGSAAARNVSDIVLLNDSFAALPAVFSEGQRIVNGILDTMRLLLTRTVYVLAIVALSALVDVDFPFLPTQDALNSFLTAGLPPLLLALWAISGRPPQHTLEAVGRFVFPAATTIALVGIGVYLYFLHETGDDLETSRSALVTTVILCGAALTLFAKPVTNQDRRSAGLAVGVIGLLALVVATPGLRSFFDLKLLAAADYALIVAVVIVWTVVLRLIYQSGVYARVRRLIPAN
jgi:cation-transporting ATPase E